MPEQPPKILVTIPPKMTVEIDGVRGQEERSSWIARACEKQLAEQKGERLSIWSRSDGELKGCLRMLCEKHGIELAKETT